MNKDDNMDEKIKSQLKSLVRKTLNQKLDDEIAYLSKENDYKTIKMKRVNEKGYFEKLWIGFKDIDYLEGMAMILISFLIFLVSCIVVFAPIINLIAFVIILYLTSSAKGESIQENEIDHIEEELDQIIIKKKECETIRNDFIKKENISIPYMYYDLPIDEEINTFIQVNLPNVDRSEFKKYGDLIGIVYC